MFPLWFDKLSTMEGPPTHKKFLISCSTSRTSDLVPRAFSPNHQSLTTHHSSLITNMYLIVGLGNPGTQYSNTHHNAGFMAVEKLADPNKDWKSEHKALTMKVNIAGEECLLVKPQTYMNLSGEAVQALMTWYKVKVDHLLVFSDDVNLDVGRIRCRKDGSHGGQNGLRNIIEHVGDKFPRIRFGVGKCPPKFDLSNWVLAKFSPEDRPVFEEAIAKVPALVECYFKLGMEKCMERYNGK